MDTAAWYERQCAERCSRLLRTHPGAAERLERPRAESDERGRGAPSWLRLPVALAAGWAPPGAPADDLLDVIWGQFAVYYAIRLQDDLLDAHSDDLGLQFLADRFIVESLEALQPLHRLDAGFWKEYRDALRTTAEGIIEVARLQREPGVFGAAHLHLHARVNAIFRIGVTAVCWLHGRPNEMTWIAPFQAQLAIFDQLMDDLEDVTDDIPAGRYTFAGNVLLRATPETFGDEGVRERLRRGFLDPEREKPIVTELRAAAERASALLPAHAPDEFRTIAAAALETVEQLPALLHRSRVRLLLGPS